MMGDWSMKKQPASTLLGLALDGNRLEGVVLRRANGSLKAQKTVSGVLSLRLLADDPELVGREIRNLLDQSGVRERRCLFCLPVSWLTTLQVRLPELSDEDAASFLDVEAERGFHMGPDQLAIVTSRFATPAGERFATQMAAPLASLARLDQVLRAARLRPVSFTPGIIALESLVEAEAEAGEGEGRLCLLPGEDKMDLLLTAGGGVVALRSLDLPDARDDGEDESLLREIRITLGQAPADWQGRFRRAHLHGTGRTDGKLMQDLTLELEDMGIQCENREMTFPSELEGKLPPGTSASPVVVATARHLKGLATGFEFLPPRVSSWQRFTRRVSARKLAWAGAAAAALVLLVGGAFLLQQWRLSRLENRWAAIQPQVVELDALQRRIRQYRPWFDTSMQGLTILRRLTESFPEDGRVTAKTLEIRQSSIVACAGTARDNQALLDTLDRLRATPGVGGVKVDQIRGKSPLQFVFNFQWAPAGTP